MPYSYNGWWASPNLSDIGSVRTVPDTSVRLSVHYGSPGSILIYVADQFNKRVEPLEGGASDDGGWNYRTVSGSASLSNHASATAIDLNWNKHPRGVHNTFTPAQIVVIRQILAECHGAVYWGGDYRSPSIVDDMHFEISTNQSGCDWAWGLIQAEQNEEDDDMPYGLPLDLHGLLKGEHKEFTIAPVNTGNLGFGKAWVSFGCGGGDVVLYGAYQIDGENFWRPLFGPSWDTDTTRTIKSGEPRSKHGLALPDGTGKLELGFQDVITEDPTKFSVSGFIEYGRK